MEKTVLNIKTDKKVKEEAQKAARELGLPLGTIVNAYLRELAREKRVVFSVPPTPNRRMQELLRKMLRSKKSKRDSAGPFTYEQALARRVERTSKH